MNNISQYLSEKYNYNPGRYQGYSLETPSYKIMGRLDWNINNNNKINFRFTHTHSKYSANLPLPPPRLKIQSFIRAE